MDFIQDGYNAFGCDIAFKEGPNVAHLSGTGHIRLVDKTTYRLPFDNGIFDVVISDQVFEHVQDYKAALREICRVLRPDGISVHFFPSRYIPIEPHVHVPFASIIQSYPWLRLWAGLGIRSPTQRGLTATEVAKKNYTYLTTSTNYLPRKKIVEEFSHFFNKVAFAEQFFLKYSRRGQLIYKLSSIVPFIPAVYSTLGSRVVVGSAPCLSRI